MTPEDIFTEHFWHDPWFPPMETGTQWEEDCLRERGRILTGYLKHWCPDWDYLTMDETCAMEWPCACWREDCA